LEYWSIGKLDIAYYIDIINPLLQYSITPILSLVTFNSRPNASYVNNGSGVFRNLGLHPQTAATATIANRIRLFAPV
jgi:hypothetical protein